MDELVWNAERACWTVKETATYLVEISPMLFGLHAVVMTPKVMNGTYDDRWDYDGFMPALAAVLEWDAENYVFSGYDVPPSEPQGWNRHLPTGRRRKNGDPSTEEIRHD